MAKAAVDDYSATAASNTDIDGLDSTGATGVVKSGDNYTRSMMAHLKAKMNDLGAVNTVAGTADAITVTLAAAPTALVDGMRFTFSATAANTGATTLNVTPAGGSAFGAKKVRKWAAGVESALAAGDIAGAGSLVEVIYDSAADAAAGAFILASAVANLDTLWAKGSDVASAGTISLGAGNWFHITGTTTITDIDFASPKDGRTAWLEFDGILTLTHNSTTLNLPGAANITTAAGDRAMIVQDSGDNIHCLVYTRAAAAPGSDYQHVATISASASSAINFDTSNSITIADGYDYIIKCIDVKPSADCAVAIQYGTGATPTYQTSGYTQQIVVFFGASSSPARDGVTTGIQFTNGMGGTSAGETFDAEITIGRPGANTIHKMMSSFVGFAADGLVNTAMSGGWRSTAEVLTGIRVVPSTGNFTSGTFVLYRRKVA